MWLLLSLWPSGGAGSAQGANRGYRGVQRLALSRVVAAHERSAAVEFPGALCSIVRVPCAEPVTPSKAHPALSPLRFLPCSPVSMLCSALLLPNAPLRLSHLLTCRPAAPSFCRQSLEAQRGRLLKKAAKYCDCRPHDRPRRPTVQLAGAHLRVTGNRPKTPGPHQSSPQALDQFRALPQWQARVLCPSA